MPYRDFRSTQDHSFPDPLPADVYDFKIEGVDVAMPKDHEVWTMRLRVLTGEHKGRKFFDQLRWTEKAEPRIKLVYRRLGYPVDDGPRHYRSSDLVGFCVRGEVVEDVRNGEVQRDNEGRVRTKIAYDGYALMEGVEQPPLADNDAAAGAADPNAGVTPGQQQDFGDVPF